MADNDKTIVSRIQHRRGLKQDLPQPLRPGEIGLATDSRQLYIGGDPTNPATADYHSVSYYENTLSAKDHVSSIANNNIIAFNVPCVRFVEGEFNGSSKVKSWQPTDSRSIIGGVKASAYSDSTYPVFSAVSTATIVSNLSATKPAGSFEIQVANIAGTDDTGNIRVNDEIIISGYSGTRPKVNTVAKHTSGYYVITIDQSISELANGTAVSFVPKHQKNMFTDVGFHSEDVTVVKNSIELSGEKTSTLFLPGANVDFAIDGSNISSVGTHTLNMRTIPTVSDSVALTYYSNANVIAAIEGVQSGSHKGNISTHVPLQSFYQNTTLWDSGLLPSYKQFKKENIQISKSTGVGYIGLDTIHITSTADGANLTATTGLTLGKLYIAREDETQAVTGIASEDDGHSYVVTFSSSADADRYQTIAAAGVYKYSEIMFVGSTGNENEYLSRSKFAVSGTGSSTLTIAMPALAYTVSRSAGANVEIDSAYPGNGFTGTSETTCVIKVYDSTLKTNEVKPNDYVRIIDNLGDAANCTLHDTLFKVIDTKIKSHFTIRVNTNDILTSNSNVTFAANIAAGGIKYVNHGSVSADVDSTIQIISDAHGISTGTTSIKATGPVVLTTGATYDIKNTTADITTDTFYVENLPTNMVSSAQLLNESGAGGLISAGAIGIEPRSAMSFGSTTFKAVPVLSVDLSANTTVASAIATVNKNLVQIGSANVQIYPQLNWIPQDDGALNAVYLSQRPAYSSVATGGLEFTLFEDTTTATLSVLGLADKLYDRANNTVKAKFETWLNTTVNSRDVNLFSNVFPGDNDGAEPIPASITYATLSSKSTNINKPYLLHIDNTFNEITFGSREEAGIFNNVVNRIYGTSLYDKLLDTNKGSRGLVNLKNNIEISTREAASFGNKITSYNSMEQIILLPGDNGIPGSGAVASGDLSTARLVATFDTGSTFNVYKVDYSMQESTLESANKYIRTGTWTIAGRKDFTDTANAVIFNDSFSSHSQITTHTNQLVEPKFRAQMSSTGLVSIYLVGNQLEAESNTNITHNLGVQVKLKYVQDRWSALS